jgi:surfactin family lipopeptide synthetase B
LYVGGDGVSLGYLNREDLNSRCFIEHPFIKGERLYKTGDYTRWLPDGNLEFHGRTDNQLKIRGLRVELDEIESVLSELEGVVESVVKPVKIAEGDYWLIAFLNVSESFGMDSGDISGKIKGKLPAYMIPSAYKLMHGFPTTINGKIDRKALIFEAGEIKNRDTSGTADFTRSEEIIYDIWSKTLKTSNISLTDNFFDIGGNSLLAISVFSKIEAAFNIEPGLRIFFDSPRIKDLAETIDMFIKREADKKSADLKKIAHGKVIGGEI